MAENGFLSRWSRKKAGLAEEPVEPVKADVIEKTTEKTTEKKTDISSTSTDQNLEQKNSVLPEVDRSSEASEKLPPPPTMEDVEKIDSKAADFSAFMRPDVDPKVQQAAMRKMFSDPHFNVMDGLDIYIDDYTKSEPIPLDMLKRMNQSELLGLFKSAEELYPDSKKDEADKTQAEELPAESQTAQGASEPSIEPPQDNAQQIDLESNPSALKADENIPIGERQTKRDSDQQES